jgi:tRNA threonylcarbamoyladenosine biosynthesis protein TsaB
MSVLGIESSGDRGGVALVEGGEVRAEARLDLGGSHTRKLLPAVHAVLVDAGLEVRDLTGVAVSLGPGSFTGLRAGVALAKGFAYARGLALAGVPALEGMAAGRRTGGELSLTLVVADARRGDLFWALYRTGAGGPVEVRATALGDLERVADTLARELPDEGPIDLLAGDSVEVEALEQALVGRGLRVGRVERGEARPAWVALRGEARLAAGKREDPMTLEPLYVRPSDAEGRVRP